ncbi:MAG: cation transporter [Burkholderiales bacterium RIFCSPLOWO2_02_FULL_57_36]|nr:MAG: cation transporter [Burkholderiales bacterium RIFCSPLOWO2_02_FULL_57_36]
MRIVDRLLDNHPLANITFVVVLLLGFLTYISMPRAQDPEINFNWVSIVTVLPGASAADVERELTSPLEDALRQVKDIKYVSSNSRESISSILVRFNELPGREFDKRMVDLRREVQNKASQEFPPEIDDPVVMEITSSNGFPTAMVAVHGMAEGEQLRRIAAQIRTDLRDVKGVDSLLATGLPDPELHVDFDPRALEVRGANATQVSDAVAGWFRNTLGGRAKVADREWLVRMEGKTPDPDTVARMSVPNVAGDFSLDKVGGVSRGTERVNQRVSYNDQPAIIFAITKQAQANTLELVDQLRKMIKDKNAVLADQGVQLSLIDDQTHPTRNAISIMETNAMYGWIFVMAVCWIFLGTRIAVLVGLGIPFSLAATFFILGVTGSTLNLTVLLGVVISLGMLVDDAVVVVESIYYRLQRGEEVRSAVVNGVSEVALPVLSSILTTCAAFLPLMLLPGILGKFMFVVPFVVTTALLVSLLEAYWILPVHVMALRPKFENKSRVQLWRERFTHNFRVKYSVWLIKVMRWPKLSLAVTALFLVASVGMVVGGLVKIQFFAFDPIRLFYVNVDMPAGVALDKTHAEVESILKQAEPAFATGEIRSLTANSGIKWTDTEPLYGAQYGQMIVSLNPRTGDMRETPLVVNAVRKQLENYRGEGRISFLELSGGPPTAKPISVKIRGDDYKQLRAATDQLIAAAAGIKGVKDLADDDVPGRQELTLSLKREALAQSGVSAGYVARLLRLYGEGETVASIRDAGEKVNVVVRARPETLDDIDAVLAYRIPLPQGGSVALGQLVDAKMQESKGFIRHYKFRRAITIEGNLDKEVIDTVAANNQLKAAWAGMQNRYPGVDLDFSGELDDIQESIDSMAKLFAIGVGLIYLILAAQFRSYWQPMLILVTVPLAFVGVVLGLFVSGNPLSLYTLYGVIALAGIAVNSAIVLIDAANERIAAGMSITHATLYAARRRLIPIVITSTTTIAGLFSLAVGLGGKSLIWGPVASSIVWGLGFSTVLTLFVIPLLFRLVMTPRRRRSGFALPFRRKPA